MTLFAVLLWLFQPPTAPEVPAEGIAGALERRIAEAVVERTNERYDALGDRLKAIVNDLAAAAQTRREMLAEQREARSMRVTLLAKIADLVREQRETRERWTPLQNLADRLIALGWKLIGVVILFAVLIEGTRIVFLWLVERMFGSFKRALVPKKVES